MKEVLFNFNPWWESQWSFDSIIREKYFSKLVSSVELRDIIFLIGIRRVGKTTLMKELINDLLQKGISSNNILYISCEHPIFDKYTILEVISEFKTLFSHDNTEKLYLFFDEIQFKEDFERELKILYDNYESLKIFCSGSSASILRDKKAFLTGRQRTFEIEPLDFKEYLSFRNYSIKSSMPHLTKSYFDEYLRFGGMPEYVLKRDSDYLLQLIDTILQKDIVSFHSIKNSKLVRDLFILLCERVGKQLSYTKLSKVLGVSVDTIMTYVSYFEDSYLISIVEKATPSLNERKRAQKKIYITDHGMRNILVGFRDIGAIYENVVFNKIKSHSPGYYLTKDGREIDFVFDDVAIEAKFKNQISEEDTSPLISSKFKTKLLAKDYTFFLEDEFPQVSRF